jgi:hypothetical protein
MEQFPTRTSRSECVQRTSFPEGAEGFSPLKKGTEKEGLQARALYLLSKNQAAGFCTDLRQSEEISPK